MPRCLCSSAWVFTCISSHGRYQA